MIKQAYAIVFSSIFIVTAVTVIILNQIKTTVEVSQSSKNVDTHDWLQQECHVCNAAWDNP